MRKILIIGAGFLQSFIIKKAKEMGLYVIAVDGNPKAPGFKYSDISYAIDIVDKEACLQIAKSHGIDGVTTGATDFGVITTAYIANKLNLPGLNIDIAKMIKNKLMVRKRLSDAQIDDLQLFYEINDVNQLINLKSVLVYPLMVKPLDGSGSKGASKVESYKELKTAIEFACENSISRTALLEQFILGKEYGVESFVLDGQVKMIEIIGKQMTQPPIFAELGHYYPSNIPNEQKIINIIHQAIKSLGINFGSVNMDFLLTEDGKVYIVDVGARMGGNLIGSHIIPKGTSIDYIGNIIKASLAIDDIDFSIKLRSNVSTKILALSPGKIKSLPDFNIIEKDQNVKIFPLFNHQINSYLNNLDGCGYIVASDSDSLDLLEYKTENIKKYINNQIEREDEHV